MKKIMLTLLTIVLSFNVYSQSLIEKQTIKIIVPSAPGGGLDITSRIIGKNLSEIMNVTVIVENKPGANGVIAARSLLSEESDGKTLLFYTPHSYTLNNLFAENTNQIFEWEKELAPISMMYWSPFMLLVNKKMNVNTLIELKEKFKNKEISYGSTGSGTPSHIYAEIVFDKLGIKSIHIPYKSLPQISNDVLNGTLDVIFSSSLVTHVRAGNLVPLLLLSDKPNAEFTNLQTLNMDFSEYSNLKVIGSFLVSKNTNSTLKVKLIRDVELAIKKSLEELKQKNIVDVSESVIFDEKKMKQIEKNWITAVERIRNKK